MELNKKKIMTNLISNLVTTLAEVKVTCD